MLTDSVVAAVLRRRAEQTSAGRKDEYPYTEGEVKAEEVVGSESEREIRLRLTNHSKRLDQHSTWTRKLEGHVATLNHTVKTMGEELSVTKGELKAAQKKLDEASARAEAEISNLIQQLTSTGQQLQMLQMRVEEQLG